MAIRFVLLVVLCTLGALAPRMAWATSDAPALLPFTAAADTVRPDSIRPMRVALPNVTVEASRVLHSALTSPARLTTLDAETIRRSGTQTVAELLEARTDLFIRRYGAGGLATVSLRGTGSNQTLILLDGQRVADPQTGQVDLSLIPTALIESVDVLHGAHSAQYGSDGIGGVVRLQTLQPTQPLQARLTGGVAAYDEQQISGLLSGGDGSLSGLVAVEHRTATGDFSYRNEALFPARVVQRENADRALTSLFTKARVESGVHDVSVAGWYSDVERGLPGLSNAPGSGGRQHDAHLRLTAHSTSQLEWGVLEMRGRVQRSERRYEHLSTGRRDTSGTHAYDLSVALVTDVGPRWQMTGGSSVGLDWTSLQNGLHRTRTSISLSGTGTYGPLTLYPALRADTHWSPGGDVAALSPQLGVSVQPVTWNGWRLKGHIGRSFRAPTFGERYDTPGGNPDLDAERGWSAEVGSVAQVQRPAFIGRAEATLFTTRINNQVVWYPSYVDAGLRVWTPGNIGRVVSQGLETSAFGQWQPTSTFSVQGTIRFTHTRAENRSTPGALDFGQQLRYVPRQQLKLHLGASLGRFGLDVSGRAVGQRFTSDDESRHLPSYHVLDVRAQYQQPLGPLRATLSLAVENVTDASYAIIASYPMPPRHVRMRLALDL